MHNKLNTINPDIINLTILGVSLPANKKDMMKVKASLEQVLTPLIRKNSKKDISNTATATASPKKRF